MTTSIILYTKDYCPYCKRAKALLQAKGVTFKNIEITNDPDATQEMIEKSGRFTVPQIFIGERHIGGSDDLFKLDADGKLDPLLDSLLAA